MADVTKEDIEKAAQIIPCTRCINEMSCPNYHTRVGCPEKIVGFVPTALVRKEIAQALADRGVTARVAMGNEAAKFVMRSWGSRGNLPLAVLAESIQRRASEPEPPPKESKNG